MISRLIYIICWSSYILYCSWEQDVPLIIVSLKRICFWPLSTLRNVLLSLLLGTEHYNLKTSISSFSFEKSLVFISSTISSFFFPLSWRFYDSDLSSFTSILATPWLVYLNSILSCCILGKLLNRVLQLTNACVIHNLLAVLLIYGVL